MNVRDLLIAAGLAVIFAAIFASMFDLAPLAAKALVRQAARWWKSDLDSPEQLAEEWQALIDVRPVGVLKIATGLRFWIRGAIRQIRFAMRRRPERGSINVAAQLDENWRKAPDRAGVGEYLRYQAMIRIPLSQRVNEAQRRLEERQRAEYGKPGFRSFRCERARRKFQRAADALERADARFVADLTGTLITYGHNEESVRRIVDRVNAMSSPIQVSSSARISAAVRQLVDERSKQEERLD